MSLPLVASKLAASPVALFAGGGTPTFDVSTIVSGAVESTQSQVFTVLGIVVPAIVTVTAAVVGIKFAIGWVRKIRG
ncbi:MAG: hypothetical protein K2L82_07510 [Lachnospiraceae bacterium]|nr:hypothetical protein [Lachnospiraceae bacterium]